MNMTTRTVVGRHGWSIKRESAPPMKPSHANNWLKSLASRSHAQFEECRRNSQRKQYPPAQKEIIDPFHDLPSFSTAISAAERAAQAQATMDMLAFIRRSNRKPMKIAEDKNKNIITEINPMRSWRKFAADFQLLKSVHSAPSQFPRELRHLDSTLSREVHKVAVIYVGEGQEDKSSILSNSSGSSHFNYFVEGLGWPVTMGPNHLGYAGGLPPGQTAPYYATADTELVYHVSTMIAGEFVSLMSLIYECRFR